MTAILVTGMSGVGKSTALGDLAARGYEVVDTDEGDWIEVVDGEPLWRLPLVVELLARPRAGVLVVQGTVANQGSLYDAFDAVVLLTAPVEVALERLRSRTTNGYGRSAAEQAKVAAEFVEVEPLLRAGASHVIDTRGTRTEVADALEAIARSR